MRTITRDIPYLLSLWDLKTCDTFTSFIHFLRSILYIMSDIVRNFIVGLLALVEEINRLLSVRVDFEQLVTNIARLEEAIDRLCWLLSGSAKITSEGVLPTLKANLKTWRGIWKLYNCSFSRRKGCSNMRHINARGNRAMSGDRDS